MASRKELDVIADALGTTLGLMVGHGYVRQCRAVGTGDDLRVSIVLAAPAAIRLAKVLAQVGLSELRGAELGRVRVRCVDRLKNQQFIFRSGRGDWHCVSPTGMPMGFSYAGIDREMECKFALSDCTTADEVLAVIRRFSSHDVSLLES